MRVVHEKLRAPSEQVRQGRAALSRLEAVVLLHPDPRELLPLPGQLVAAPGQVLLGVEQLEPVRKPLLTCSCAVVRHSRSLPPVAVVSPSRTEGGGSGSAGRVSPVSSRVLRL